MEVEIVRMVKTEVNAKTLVQVEFASAASSKHAVESVEAINFVSVKS